MGSVLFCCRRRQVDLKIVEKAIEDLKPYENNPRHNGAAVEYVKNSIQKFGFKVPIIVDSANVIVAGHTRLLAAQELGLEKVPCIVADDLNEDQIRAFRLADNKVSELSSWDWDKLEEELSAMEISDIDMSDFSFDMPDFDSDTSEGSGLADFFEVAPGASESGGTSAQKKTKTITCPHCGEVFEL